MEKMPGQRVHELREMKFVTQKELAQQIGVSPSQLSRIEKGETKTISSDVLLKLADALEVSADYILGRTNISKQRNIEITATGLSEKAISQILKGNINIEILNRLLEHKNFSSLTMLIGVYFSDAAEWGIQARNQILDFGIDNLSALTVSEEQKKELKGKVMTLRSQKFASHEAEMEKIKNTFLAILKDIKKDIDAAQPPTPPAQQALIQEMLQTVVKTEQAKWTLDDIAEMTTARLRKYMPMDEKAQKQFAEMLKLLANQAAKKQGDEA